MYAHDLQENSKAREPTDLDPRPARSVTGIEHAQYASKLLGDVPWTLRELSSVIRQWILC
jgi:hypothetical protein